MNIKEKGEESKLNNLKKKLINFFKNYKIMFIVTVIIGLITHLFMMTNKLPNHDDIESIFSKGVTFELGRWGLELIKYIFPNYSMPWFNGIIMIIMIALSACLIAKILGIKSKVKQCLIGAIMITYSSVTCTLAYTFTASAYGVAIFLSVFCVYFAIKSEKKSNMIFSIICLILSLSIYQAYISLTATIFVILLIKYCLNKEEGFKNIVLKGIKYLAILILSLLIYLASVLIINYFMGSTLSEYQGASEIGNISINAIVKGVINCYMTIPRLILRDFYGLSAGSLLKIGYLATIITILILAIIQLKEVAKSSKKKMTLYIILGIILPISMNLMYLINSKIEIHSLMLYGNCFILILPLVLTEESSETKPIKYINKIIIVTLIIMLYKYIAFANESYFKLKLSYENTYSFYTTLVTRIESTKGFNEDTKIAFIGEYGGELLYPNSDYFSDLDDFTGIISNLEMISAYSKENFIKNYIGIDFNYASEEEINELQNNEKVKEMNIYPYDNSINKINDIIVIKFSNESF